MLAKNHRLAAELGQGEKDAESRRLAYNGFICSGVVAGLGVAAFFTEPLAGAGMILGAQLMSGLTEASLAWRQSQLADLVNQARLEDHRARLEAFVADPTISRVE